MNLIFCSIVFYILIVNEFNTSVLSKEDGIVDVPKDIVTVSQFIKEFHRKLEDDSYPLLKYEHTEREASYSFIDNMTYFSIRNEPADKNSSSLLRCSNVPIGSLSVEVVNSSRLSGMLLSQANITSRLVEAPCLAVFFFSPYCPFSCLAAPHVNALQRAFPTIKIAAINVILHQAYNTQLGIAGVPTLLLFHNGKAAAKFNESEYTLEMFVKFITKITGTRAAEGMYVASSDFGGPVPGILLRETDYALGLAWAVVFIALGYGITRLDRWKVLSESIAAAWREANQEHTD